MLNKHSYGSGRLLAALLAVIVCAGTAGAAETYQVDPSHTYVLFRVKHLNTGYSYGSFAGPTGRFIWNAADPSKSSITLQVNANNVNTLDAKRDKHLRSADFFDVDQFTTIAFESTSVKALDADRFEVSGDLTLLGQTRPITVTALRTGGGKDPWGKYRQGFEAVFDIQRSLWGMNYMLSGLADQVTLTVSVEGIRQ